MDIDTTGKEVCELILLVLKIKTKRATNQSKRDYGKLRYGSHVAYPLQCLIPEHSTFTCQIDQRRLAFLRGVYLPSEGFHGPDKIISVNHRSQSSIQINVRLQCLEDEGVQELLQSGCTRRTAFSVDEHPSHRSTYDLETICIGMIGWGDGSAVFAT